MAQDLAEIDAYHKSLPADVLEELQELGRQFSSDDTIKQGDLTLNGLDQYAGELAEHGFTAEDVAALRLNHSRLSLAVTSRTGAQAGRKSTNAALLVAMKGAKVRRRSLRSLVQGAPQKLRTVNTEASRKAATEVTSVLAQTSAAGADPKKVAGQIDLLVGLLENPEVRAVVGAEQADAKAARGREAAVAVRAASSAQAAPLGTPEETRRMDLLDGAIVILCRRARAAARSAAEELGNPAIAKAFELVGLYGR
jgi:hypothetical protein